ncbi:hypothetical protein LJC63_07115 [Ruminococcaceae bacterium OttesenSCG-928-L11]|nr:hypothetical protein [Ruminococcaceae bacterium OttesenSCG-928-L11]
MFDRRFWVTGLALALTTTLALALAGIPQEQEAVPMQEPVSNIRQQENSAPSPEEPPDEEPEYAYILKEYEGRVAVFVPGSDEPQMTFDTYVRFLPDYDRIQMKAGIPVRDFEALSAIIEDYIS